MHAEIGVALGGLDPVQRALLEIVVLDNGWVSTTALLSAAKAVGVRPSDADRMTHAHVRTCARTLADAGLLTASCQGRAEFFQADPPVAMAVIEALDRQGRLAARDSPGPPGAWRSQSELGTDLRIALARDERARSRDIIDQAARHAKPDLGHWLQRTLGSTLSPDTLDRLPEDARDAVVETIVAGALRVAAPVPDHVVAAGLRSERARLRLAAARVLVLKGQLERAVACPAPPKYGAEGLRLLAAFWSGDYEQAATIGAATVASMKGRKIKILPDLEGVCHMLATLATSMSDPVRHALIGTTLEDALHGSRLRLDLFEVAMIHRGLIGDRDAARPRAKRSVCERGGWLEAWTGALHDVWIAPHPEAPRRAGPHALDPAEVIGIWQRRAVSSGYEPLARELGATADALSSGGRTGRTLVATLRGTAPWEAALSRLEAVPDAIDNPAEMDADAQARIVWEVADAPGLPEITPRILRSARARKGQEVAIGSLIMGRPRCLTAHDDKVLAAAEPDAQAHDHYGRDRWGTGPTWVLGGKALVALVGHRRVIDKRGQPVTVDLGQPRLETTRSESGVSVRLVPAALLDHEVAADPIVDGRLTVYARSPALSRVSEILRPMQGLTVPPPAIDRLERTLTRLCVAADVRIKGDVRPPSHAVSADPRPVLALHWDGTALTIRGAVAPLGLDRIHVEPGVGNPRVAAQIRTDDGPGVLRCARDLAEERRLMAQVEQRCPILESYADAAERWRIPDLADALEVLLELDALGDAVMLAWPKGRGLTPPVEREVSDLMVSVGGPRDWLAIDARVQVDEGEVLTFRELMGGRVGRRLVALDRSRYIALSERLRQRLDALDRLGRRHGDGVRASPALLRVVGELTADLDDVRFDPRARQGLDELERTQSSVPALPPGLEAELRPYQRDGYTWAWRLAQAGLGGCLADDMGLGKTVQAIALLAERSAHGPALVGCPTSVVVNWCTETARFAPGLQTIVLGESRDRAATVRGAGPGDVIVCSYGVMTSEAEAVMERRYATVVFDEAHAFKNDDTKRAQTAARIEADFRLGLTGTPVENRVGELWSLFHVLVPGLLGDKVGFAERFAKPMADGDRQAAADLRTLVRPFLLRRTKSEVARELPPRTEVTVTVPAGPEQRSYYEALRQAAVQRVKNASRERRQIQLFAEITRLRQAAIDPRLLDPETGPAGTKIDALVDRVAKLRDEGHRVLVFTQFLTSLAMVCEGLRARGLDVVTLQGSTPAVERARRVDAFQAGRGDAFVISLRAGGVGMNLTAADYVLHLDPWWNPAVEDQATDRAHRIGQRKPVTVYRLVTEGTIEDKIMGLHTAKREMAHDLLSGMQDGAGVDVEVLMSLLEG